MTVDIHGFVVGYQSLLPTRRQLIGHLLFYDIINFLLFNNNRQQARRVLLPAFEQTVVLPVRMESILIINNIKSIMQRIIHRRKHFHPVTNSIDTINFPK
jgi:hypothetical protein